MPPKYMRGKNRFFKRQQPYREKEYKHTIQLNETDVGITEFISDLKGFTGIIKARYSDFQVNEINLAGEIAKLTDTSVPKDFSDVVELNYNDAEQSPLKHITQETWDALKTIATSENSEPIYLPAKDLTKAERKEVHLCVKSYFGKKIVAKTTEKDGSAHLLFKKFNKSEKEAFGLKWPEDKGEYVYFLVYKEKLDTLDACFKISNNLKVPVSKFSYAGNKDKRSITTQWFCVRKVVPAALMTKTRKLPFIKIGNLSYKNEPLKLGQLRGNKFRIALRNVTGSNELIDQAMSQLKLNGFINFYGLQRFGNDKAVPTFLVGLKLLLGKWKEAVKLILKIKSSDDPTSSARDLVKAKQVYEKTEDAALAYKELYGKNRNRSVEAKLLEGLKKSGNNDYVNALENIPRTTRLLYLHSFQSLIWNKMVSKRLQLFGRKPVEGDLILVNETDETKIECIESVEETENIMEEEDDEGKVDEKEVTEKEEDEKAEDNALKCKQEVKALKSDELLNYSIYDIVLPLPGYDVIYPENMKQYYKEALEEYGLSLEMTRQKVRTYTLSGNYRKILQTVKDLSWKTIRYNNPTDDLIRSDYEELQGKPEIQSLESGQYKALCMEFSLTPSSYATMLLREVLKMDTSSSAHAKLNDYHDKEKKIMVDDDDDDDISVDNNDSTAEDSEVAPQNSLLSNPDKFELFKNSIFNCTSEPVKRKNESEEDSNKKPKLAEEDHGRIKTQASLD